MLRDNNEIGFFREQYEECTQIGKPRHEEEQVMLMPKEKKTSEISSGLSQRQVLATSVLSAHPTSSPADPPGRARAGHMEHPFPSLHYELAAHVLQIQHSFTVQGPLARGRDVVLG